MQTVAHSLDPQAGANHQQPFALVAPFLAAALILGVTGGFALATTLTLTRWLRVPTGPWWVAAAQAHGHLQLYGWAGLFVLGVALHFLPRLRGAPLVGSRWVPWVLGSQVAGLVLRGVSQPLASATGGASWRTALVASAVLECVALLGAVGIVAATFRQGPPLRTRPALRGVLPFFIVAFSALFAAAAINMVNAVQAAASLLVLVPAGGDALNVTLGLLGFLVPVALAMSAQSLPMYAGLQPFPRGILWPLAGIYASGLTLLCVGTAAGAAPGMWSGRLAGLGMLLVGGVLLVFVIVFMRMMRARGQLPAKVASLAPRPEVAARSYHVHIAAQRSAYGPFVALVASSYLWAVLGGILLALDGGAELMGATPPVVLDAILHSLTVGFIALLICGIAPRMVPGFSGGRIVSPALVSATLWLGNGAAILRVGALLAGPLLAASTIGQQIDAVAFGLSGPTGLTLAICLLINLWPAIWPRPATTRVG